MVRIEDYLQYEQPTKYIVSSTEYDDKFKTPVLTPGQSFILGYTDEENNIFDAKQEPIILFDDFTTSVKYVDFPFKVKSSASKILHATDKCDIKYAYYMLKSLKQDTRTHKRYWISTISKIEIPERNIEEQVAIAEELSKVEEMIKIKEKILDDLDKLERSLFNEFYSQDKAEIQLSSLLDVRDGTHDSPKYLKESDYVLVTGKNIIDGKIDFETAKYISEKDYNEINKRSKVDEGDIIMPMIGTIGNPIIINKIDRNFAIKNVALFKKSEKILPEYLISFLKSDFFTEYNKGKNRGGVQKFLALKDIRMMPIKAFEPEEQKRYIDKVNKIEAQKEMIRNDIVDLNELLDNKIDNYFN